MGLGINLYFRIEFGFVPGHIHMSCLAQILSRPRHFHEEEGDWGGWRRAKPAGTHPVDPQPGATARDPEELEMESDDGVPLRLQSALVNLNPAEGRLSAEVGAAAGSFGRWWWSAFAGFFC